MIVTEEWARNIVQTRFETFDREVVERAKERIIDIVGCAIGGVNGSGNQALVDLVKEWGGKEEATILVHGVRAPAYNVAMVNSIMARSFDYGGYGPRIPDIASCPAHISESAVPTAITMTEREHTSGRELITALILGEDIDARLAAATPPDFLSVGWCSTGIFNKFSATAIAGKLRGLDEQQLANAFGIVVNQLAGSMQCVWEGSHSFKLHHGLSARDGIIATELASRGWTGMKDPLFSRYGFFTLYTSCQDPEVLTKDLGKKYYADSYVKPYPCCGVTHPPVACTLELVREHDMKTEDIDEVIVNVSPMARDSQCGQPYPIQPGEFPQGYALFNTRYSVASILVRKDLRLEYFTEEYIGEPRVADFIKKVKVTGEMPPEKAMAVEVKVRMKNGREFCKGIDAAKGLTGEEIEEKFRGNVAFSKTVTKANAEEALSMLKRLDEFDDISEIIKLLVA